MSCTFTPSLCHIDLSALGRNFQKLGRPDKIMPVIKADAYGHGLLPVAITLETKGARRFAVGTANEGTLLRQNGFTQEIVLLMGCQGEADWDQAVEYELTPIAASLEELEEAERACMRHGGKKLKIAIKCDTGMSRLGFTIDHLPQLLDRLARSSCFAPSMLLSHFACADMPEEDNFTKKQIELFNEFYAGLTDRYPGLPRSLGNSAALLGISDPVFDIYRPGYALYGGNPFAGTNLENKGKNLEWVMSVSSPVMQVRNLAKGQSVSYGRIFTAPEPMRVAIVACGYATGFSRNLSGRASMLVHGRRAPQIGRVCMGMTLLDVSHIPETARGDEVWIMGGEAAPDQKAITAEEIAAVLGTIPYEIMCLFGGMNPRVYNK